jgi:hypothetical protein
MADLSAWANPMQFSDPSPVCPAGKMFMLRIVVDAHEH